MAKILLVEDDTGMANLVIDCLEVDGHTIEYAEDGLDAASRLALYQYDLAILDWNLPGLSGVEICSQYRMRGGTMPVIMLTAKGAEDEKEEGLDSGADDYLTKPFGNRELRARVRALLRRPQEFISDKIQIGVLTIEPTNFKVTVAGKDVQLQPREFALLEFLMRHPNQIFSAEMLLDRVWSSDENVSPTSVRMCIKRLRSKLGNDELIENVFSQGYKLVKK
jgi:DNA-binding response OmpR family regulator